jgi:four helix bundle protein
MSTPQTLRTAGVAAARDYQDLPAWQKSLALAERVFKATESFPAREHAGLASQIRVKAIEVTSSIAAASGRNNEFGMTDSYSKAQSATAELTTLLALASRLDYIDATEASKIAADNEEVSRLIVGLKHGLKVAAKDAERAERQSRDDENTARAERPARREYKPRDGGSDRPRREYKPRDGGDDRPRREYKPRDGGDDRPRREYKPRDGGEDRPRREYKPRDGAPSGDRKPYGDKKPYGDRKPYGDKKPYGDRKPYSDRKPNGDKPFRKPRDRS